MEPIMLIIEKSKGEYWGRLHYEDNLLIDSARSVAGLERKMKKLLKDFHDLNPQNIVFEHHYDLTAMFENFDYLNISAIAQRAQMNPALLRQYASGVKHPSLKQAKNVESAIHKIGSELLKVGIYAPSVIALLAAVWRLFCAPENVNIFPARFFRNPNTCFSFVAW